MGTFHSPIRHELPTDRISFCYQRADWDSSCDLLREVRWNDGCNHTVQKCATEVSLWVKIDIKAFAQSRKYQVKLRSFPCLFVTVTNGCKPILKEGRSLFADRMKPRITSHKFGCRDYWCLCKSALNNRKCSVPSHFNQFKVLTHTDTDTDTHADTYTYTYFYNLFTGLLVFLKLTLRLEASV